MLSGGEFAARDFASWRDQFAYHIRHAGGPSGTACTSSSKRAAGTGISQAASVSPRCGGVTKQAGFDHYSSSFEATGNSQEDREQHFSMFDVNGNDNDLATAHVVAGSAEAAMRDPQCGEQQ